MTFEDEIESSLDAIKKNLKKGHDLPESSLDNTKIHGASAEKTYRPSAKRIFPLRTTYMENAKRLYGKGRPDEAKVQADRHKARVQNADSKTWTLKGRAVSRFQLMVHIIEEMGKGRTLSKICEGPGFPLVSTVLTWKEEHPDFKKALELAKKVQAQVFADEALDGMREEMDPKSAALIKNKHDALMKRAALQSPDFREKQPAPAEAPADDIKAMQEQLLAMLSADDSVLPPEVARLIRDAIEGKPKGGLTISLASEE